MYRDKEYINRMPFHSERGEYLWNEEITYALGLAWTQWT